MVNVLLNYYNFDEDWAFNALKGYLYGKKVVVLPLSFRDTQAWDNTSWQALFGKGGEKYDTIVKPFFAYGVSPQDIAWVNYFEDDTNLAKQKISNAQVLFFTGGLPEKTTARLTEMQLIDTLKNFDGVVMGASAGAMFQLDSYHVTPDDDYPTFFFDKGVGLVSGFDIEVHFENTPIQQECMAKAKAKHGKTIYCMWHQGGLIVDKNVKIIGKVDKF